jgi:hypothetical protein
MKKYLKWSVIIPVLMATLLMVVSPTAALAQSDEDAATDSRPATQGALAIVAPRIARVGQEISMTVFLRSNQEPFAGAGVWAFTREKAEIMRQEMTALRDNTSLTAEEKDYEALADIHGTFIGRTGDDGKLYHTFREEGVYVLAAIKRGYFPGFTSIYVGEIPRALAIEAPRRAKVGEEVNMTVYQKGTSEPVEGAGVWAITRDNVEVLKEEMSVLREDVSIASEDKDYESVVDIYGTFLGRTDERGNLSHTFEEEGVYVLVAVKRGYFPGSSPILIGNMQQGLTLWAPYRALVGQDVIMTVYQRGTTQPVEDAGIWAISRDKVEALKEELASLRESASVSSGEMDYEALIDILGTFLGRTDERGQLVHAFREEGSYLLVTVKRGYFPGFSPIRIMTIPSSDVPRDSGERETGVDDAASLVEPDNEESQADENNEQNTY